MKELIARLKKLSGTEKYVLLIQTASLLPLLYFIIGSGEAVTYTSEGIPAGLCKARRLTYIMTAGGNFVPEEYGPGYVRSLAQNFYGIPEFRLIKAIGLDVDGANIDSIMNIAKADMESGTC